MFLCIEKILWFGVVLLLRIELSWQQEEDIPHNEVKNWALKFGVDLWEFGRQVTKMSEIQKKYHGLEDDKRDVVKRDGLVLVREMAGEVKNLMDFKVNAVMKLMESAEQAAVSAPREGNVSPKYYASHRISAITSDGKLSSGSREMYMATNRHFDHLAVNVSLSAVLLPSGVKDTDPEVATGIQWTEYLDPLFVNNYENDPTLSWQYYGATSGFLRRFPAITWPSIAGSSGRKSQSEGVTRDVYDFRNLNWFVGAANSPKDVVILLDNSVFSSSKNQRLTVATTKAILDTLGPNDYVNVYQYGENAEEIVLCFKDTMVQASPENIQEIKSVLGSTKVEASTNISAAFTTAFEILHKYNRTGQGSQCNQAIMLLTADSEGVPTEVIKRYNWPHMPVRIFTYMIGSDKSPELHNTACTNKGFYARIMKPEDVRPKVLEYIKVLARPMVLYQHDHPIHWSPVYVGGKSDRYGMEDKGQLMTSVTAPILDRRNHTVKTANLLGVVGTDVPIEEIQKLVSPYKLGVNGYSFLVDNNGRVLYHPDLRPLPESIDYEDTLRPSYISVDLSEVELALNNSYLLDLRHDMIDQKEGVTGFAVKIHYDNMRRVSTRRHNYFYKPIEGTPFSLGLALPEGYGMYELLAEQEIRHAIVNVTDYFKGKNWKVHPDWIYCEYNSASEKFFATPEERILHFLMRTRRPGWKWMSLRPRSPSSHHSQASKMDKDAYYCDKRLVQSLVLDALITDGFDKRDGNAMHKAEHQNKGKGRFDVTRSFIATRSGLFRWHEHQDSKDVYEDPNFADLHARAMDSSWYRRAVDQHSIEPESFVFSVPFDAADNPNPLVTATHAVFVENKGHKAPAAVVGLQFQHASLASHFANITSTCTGMPERCKKNCASDDLDCYILDNSGFIIISELHEHTGKFFGEIDGTIMDSLVQDKIYRKVTVIDYQGICVPQESHQSAGTRTISDSFMKSTALLGHFLWNLLLNFSIQDLWQTVLSYAEHTIEFDDDTVFVEDDDTQNFDPLNPSGEGGGEGQPREFDDFVGYPAVLPASISPPTTRATSAHFPYQKLQTCEKKTDLYIFQPERLNTSSPLKGKLTNCHVTGCERPFSVQKIPHTNLILLVVDTLCPCGSKHLSIDPIEAVSEAGKCSARRERLYRRRPPKCINYHPEEMEIKFCGGSCSLSSCFSLSTVFFLVIVTRFT
ncbi:voltage-dependent calcium channel subunit alpha-2/delta-3 isoform X2 [Prorops nasuta]|uniref:voltage-dependent calcium channel subunit alpha-2/delta-3 isoform X2 n=1 Tax=Prorops nasuta TaxID=863751 RepID=UPI0034CF0E06